MGVTSRNIRTIVQAANINIGLQISIELQVIFPRPIPVYKVAKNQSMKSEESLAGES